MSTPDEQELNENPFARTVARLVAVFVILFVLTLVLLFDKIKDRVGRIYYERNMPAVLSLKSVEEAYGKPDKLCDRSKPCDEFLNTFLYQHPIPDYSGYIAYTRHFPLAPILVFYQDDLGGITGYDFGHN